MRFWVGELWVGSMPGALKARDLVRDARFALHGGGVDTDPADPAAWTGDAKLAGRAVQVTDPGTLTAFRGSGDPVPPGDFDLFRLDLVEAVLVVIGEPADHLVITSWHEGRGVTRVERR